MNSSLMRRNETARALRKASRDHGRRPLDLGKQRAVCADPGKVEGGGARSARAIGRHNRLNRKIVLHDPDPVSGQRRCQLRCRKQDGIPNPDRGSRFTELAKDSHRLSMLESRRSALPTPQRNGRNEESRSMADSCLILSEFPLGATATGHAQERD